MPLGKSSKLKLATCHADIQRFATELAAGIDKGECPGVRDIIILFGYRGEKEQNEAFERGTSKLRWPNSKHNRLPSLAVDIAPYPVEWNNLEAFKALREYALRVADRIGVKIRIISWDWPHFELAEGLPH